VLDSGDLCLKVFLHSVPKFLFCFFSSLILSSYDTWHNPLGKIQKPSIHNGCCCNNPTLAGLVMQQVTNYLREYRELSLWFSLSGISESVLLSEINL